MQLLLSFGLQLVFLHVQGDSQIVLQKDILIRNTPPSRSENISQWSLLVEMEKVKQTSLIQEGACGRQRQLIFFLFFLIFLPNLVFIL